jgi:hypothetical protein
VSGRIQAARDQWQGLGPWSRALAIVLVTLELSLRVGVAMFCLGVLLVALTGGAHFALVILGVGVLLFAVGAIARGAW